VITGPQPRSPETGRAYALLTDGSTIEIRPAGPQDAGAVRAMHAAMSPDNIYRRFFSTSPAGPEQEARRVTRPPGPEHAALLAWLGSRLVGVASFESAGQPGTAEIAFAVTDDMHQRGIATLLLEHLVSIARLRGLRAFTAETLADNSAMLSVFASAGLPAVRHLTGGVVDLTFPLPGEPGRSLDAYLDTVAARESRADVASLRHLLRPASVAVVGASRHPGGVGRAILHNIVTGGFAGRVDAVNPHARTIEGVPCVPAVSDLPQAPDLAVIAVPAEAVPGVADECGRRGVRVLTVITAGLGAAGADLLSVCRRHGMRLVGPNCFGTAVPETGLNATFAATRPSAGVAGLVVQSGGVGVTVLEHLTRLGIGVSSFASVGDKYDVSSNDMLTWWAQDGVTRMAILYVESFGSPRKFARTARRVGHQMPVLTVVAGRSAAGQRAAASHTAAAATPQATQEALFGQAGIIVTDSLGELVEAAALLSCQPLVAGNRVAIVSNAGGAAVLAADACGDNGLEVVQLSGGTRKKLLRLLPPGAAVAGPVDTGAAVPASVFRACLEDVAADEGVDAVLALAVPTAVGDLRAAVTAAQLTKPLAVVLLDQAESVRLLPSAGGDDGAAAPPVTPVPGADGTEAGRPGAPPVAGRLPAYAYPEGAARALGHAARYRAWRERQTGQVPELAGLRTDGARSLIAGFLAGKGDGGWLPADLAAQLLSCYRIPLVTTLTAGSEQETLSAAAELGGRVVLKAEARGLVRKTEARAVRLDLRTPGEVARAYRTFRQTFGPRLRRVLVQPMIDGGVEVIIGVVQEPVFGPLVVFGLGGVAAEVLGDHVARLSPLTDADADEMMHALHAAPLLFGHRGTPPADSAALADTLLRVSRLADDLPEVAEVDLNPVIARPDGAAAIDVRIRVSPAGPADPFLRRLR
jgi:acyl-CoA synthetase (NDP forming)/GNAT superfamily N-acetyltransferase